MDFAGAYVQENDLLQELLGDDDPKEIYTKTGYDESDSYDNDKVKNLYSYNEEEAAADNYNDAEDGYGAGYSSDEVVQEDPISLPTDGYSDSYTIEEDVKEEEEDKKEIKPKRPIVVEEDLPVQPSKSTLNLGNSGLLRANSNAVSAPMVNKKDEESNKKDWNKNFQAILQEEESEYKYQRLSQIAHEFIFVAETYGKVIISEINAPLDQKTIRPISIGGQAGGEKYIAQGILFKFALDVSNLYGGNDEYAQKAAGHDLKGLIHYSLANIPGLHFPLMALIHYMGYCLIAMSLLPIGKDSLKYGSADAGKTMHFDIPAINEKMKAAGEELNLKGHIAGLSKYQKNLCYGPGDIECHLGKDGRFYVLDFARTFPPEAVLQDSLAEKGQILFKLLRPELVKRNNVPLSSDAFTGFGMSDPLHKTHNREVKEATEMLFTEIIPEFAKRAKEVTDPIQFRSLGGGLVKEIHKEGINVRHLGLVRRLFGLDFNCHIQCLIEMIARVIKNKLKRQWRAITKVNQYITEEQCKQVTVVLLNKLYSDSEDATTFWTVKLPKYLKKKFRFALFASEKGSDLRNTLEKDQYAEPGLLGRIQQLTGIQLSSKAESDFHGFRSITFVHSDIERLQPVIKNMHIIDVADTQLLLWNGIKSVGQESERLFSLALQKIEQNSFLVSLQINKMLKIVYQLYQKAKKDIKSISMNLASKLLDSIIRLQPKTEAAYILYAKLRYLERATDQALDKMKEGLVVLPKSALLHAEYLKKCVQDLYKAMSLNPTEEFMDEQKTHFEAASKEGYLMGIAQAYYGALLLLFGTEEHRVEAVERLKNAEALMPHKFTSVLKLIALRFPMIRYNMPRPFHLLTHIESLLSQKHYSEFDQITNLKPVDELNDAAVIVVAKILQHLSDVELNKSETLSSATIVELLKYRANSLKRLALGGFDDLPPTFITTLALCKALTALELKDSNTTLTEVVTLLQHIQPQVLHIPSMNGLTASSLLSVTSFKNIRDLNIANAQLTKEELTEVLENSNLSRLFLDGIQTLDLALMKAHLEKNKEIVCFSARGCPITDTEIIKEFVSSGHEKLQVLILPSGRRQLFSGDQNFEAVLFTHKFPAGSRVEIKITSGQLDPEYHRLITIGIGTLMSAVNGNIRQSDAEQLMSFTEMTSTRMITFNVEGEERFAIASIYSNPQLRVTYNGKTEQFPPHLVNYACFGLNVFPNFSTHGLIKVPPRTDVSFLLPIVATFMLKRKSTI